MRSFRIAAVAGASALAMTFGSISAVSAQDSIEQDVRDVESVNPIT